MSARAPYSRCPYRALKQVASQGPHSPTSARESQAPAHKSWTHQRRSYLVPAVAPQLHVHTSHLPQFTCSPKSANRGPPKMDTVPQFPWQCCGDLEQDSLCIPAHHLRSHVPEMVASFCPVTLLRLWQPSSCFHCAVGSNPLVKRGLHPRLEVGNPSKFSFP